MTDVEFRQLLLAELDAVYRLACHLTRSRQSAEDAVQETYLRALRSADTFTLASVGIRPWLFKILHNVLITRGQKEKRERDKIEDFGESARPAEQDPRDAAGFQAIDWDNIDERLKHAIAELDLPHRAVFLLSAVEGLKYREIAEVIDVPVGTVMSRLSRVRVMLSKRLGGLAAELGYLKTAKPSNQDRQLPPEMP